MISSALIVATLPVNAIRTCFLLELEPSSIEQFSEELAKTN